jgi:hypothetical protein
MLTGGVIVSHIDHEDFDKILESIKTRLEDTVEFEEIRAIESNFDTKGMMFKSNGNKSSDGTIIVGEDNGLIAIDVSKADGEVVSFIMKDLEDDDGMEIIIKWFQDNYR